MLTSTEKAEIFIKAMKANISMHKNSSSFLTESERNLVVSELESSLQSFKDCFVEEVAEPENQLIA